MQSDVVIPVDLSNEITLTILRVDGPKVFLSLDLEQNSKKAFDKYRMPVMWIDDNPDIDMGMLKSVHDLMSDADPMHVSFSLQDKYITGAIWHGLTHEGTGPIGKIIKSNKLRVRLYYADYSIEDIELSGEALDYLKSKIKSDILGA